MEERRLVVVRDGGPIPELGGIGGPITTPTNITISAIRKMVINGRNVYACDPADPRNVNKQVKLDMMNISDENLFEKPEEPEDENPEQKDIDPEKKPEEKEESQEGPEETPESNDKTTPEESDRIIGEGAVTPEGSAMMHPADLNVMGTPESEQAVVEGAVETVNETPGQDNSEPEEKEESQEGPKSAKNNKNANRGSSRKTQDNKNSGKK